MIARIDSPMIISSFTEDQLLEVAKKVIAHGKGIQVWLLDGEMGAGKTTFVRALAEALDIKDHVSSPTFSLVNEYQRSNGDSVYHFDLYRLKNEREALDIGIEEYLYSGSLCLIEWPDQIPSLLPAEHMSIKITVNTDLSRTISLQRYEG